MFVGPYDLRHTSPPARPTNVRLATTSPAEKLTVDALVGEPHGYATTHPSVGGSTIVRLSAALAAFAGTPARPARCSRRSTPACSGSPVTRVSSTRPGWTPVKSAEPVNHPD